MLPVVLLMRAEQDLRFYQGNAVSQITDRDSVGLFMGCGLGKTISTLTGIIKRMEAFDTWRTLVVAPKRVVGTVWAEEALGWEHTHHLRFSKVIGSVKQRDAALARDADVYLINYENLKWLVDRTPVGKWPFDTVIFDELSKMKAHNSQRFKAVKKILNETETVVGLTGTPSSNGLHDLWAQVYLLDRGQRLGRNITAFRDRYFIKSFDGFSYNLRTGAEAKIHTAIEDLCISMAAEDYLELPDCIMNEVHVELDAKARAAYRELEKEFLLETEDGVVEAPTTAVLTNKLRQAANGVVYGENKAWIKIHDAKLDALESVISEAEGPVLVAYTFQSDVERIKARFKDAVVLGGDDRVIDEWNRGGIAIMVAHPASAAHGLNLQAGGNTIIWFSLTWSLEEYQQFNARLHRSGQTKSVLVHHIVTQGTADETVMKALARKEVTQTALMNALREDVKGRVE